MSPRNNWETSTKCNRNAEYACSVIAKCKWFIWVMHSAAARNCSCARCEALNYTLITFRYCAGGLQRRPTKHDTALESRPNRMTARRKMSDDAMPCQFNGACHWVSLGYTPLVSGRSSTIIFIKNFRQPFDLRSTKWNILRFHCLLPCCDAYHRCNVTEK